MNFSDYIIYVDESGDHDLSKINHEFPAFALSFCIIRKDIYVHKIVPQIQQLKFDFFGHDSVILREHDIRKEKKDFAVLMTNANLRRDFYDRLNAIMQDAEITIVASVILKEKFTIICESRGEKEDNALKLAFLEFINNRENEYFNKIQFDMIFSSKKINSVGLQLADLTARPIAINALRPQQENRAYNIIKTKFPERDWTEIFL